MQENKELPPKYYLTYFQEVISFLKEKSDHLISEPEFDFISRFEQLPENAQCLYLRLMNRRGIFFRFEKFNYPEIKNIQEARDTLFANEFASIITEAHENYKLEILRIFNKGEINKMLSITEIEPKNYNSLSKNELLEFAFNELSLLDIIEESQQFGQVIKQNFIQETEMLLFLYFGSLHGEMTSFVVRDVGNLKYESLNQDLMTSYFKNRKEAEDKYEVSKTGQFIRLMMEEAPPEEVYEFTFNWLSDHKEISELAMNRYNKLAARVGRWLEQRKMYNEAISIYSFSHEPPCRERKVRILYKLERFEEALDICLIIDESPFNAEEKYFSLDFKNKILNKKSKKIATLVKNEAETIFVSDIFKNKVELGVLDYFEEQGKNGFFSENHLWRNLFGLILWDEIFEMDQGQLHNPFQRAPSDFFKPTFLKNRRQKIKKKLAILQNQDEALALITQTFNEKLGVVNPMVSWNDDTLAIIKALLSIVKKQAIEAVLLKMAENLKENTRGFPDLFIWDDAGYSFIEVKSPNDTLSSQQLYWLEFFSEQKIKAGVLNVKWKKF